MSTSRQPDFETTGERDRLMGEVLNDILDRRARGEAINEADLCKEHPSIAGELSDYLRLLKNLRPIARTIDQLVDQGVLSSATNSQYLATLDGYNIVDLLGHGGMGIVLRAYDEHLHRDVAVKLLRPEFSSDEVTVARFAREAKVAASLRHPNIVTVHTVGTQGGVHYFSMEYVQGPTLADMIRDAGPLATDRARSIFSELLTGLGAAHEVGVIHRDIKPSNILLDGADHRVKIADFGLARMRSSQTRLTVPESVFGTPEYMSPEQARGVEGIDHRSDLYSAGVVLYEMLTGRTPFRSDTPSAVVQQILHDHPPNPRRINAHVDDRLASLALRLMAKRREDRFSTTADAVSVLHTDCVVGRPERNRRVLRRMLASVVAGSIAAAAILGALWVNSLIGRGGQEAGSVPMVPPPITAVKADPEDATLRTAIQVRRGNETAWRIFHEFPETVLAVGDVELIDPNGDGQRIIVAGLLAPLDGNCIIALDGEENKMWAVDLSTDRQWPDCAPPKAWQCRQLTVADLDGVPGDELVAVAIDSGQYATRISVIDPRYGEVRSTFWHFGTISGIRVEPNFFGKEKPGIVAWGYNNKLDGFDDGLRENERRLAHWDIVKVIMILDPSDMDGLGPPRTGRLADLPKARPHAYAFLDMPYNRKVLYVTDDGVRVPQTRVDQRERHSGGISKVGRWVGIRTPENAPWLEVFIKGAVDAGGSHDRAVLVVDRDLDIVQVRAINTAGEIEGTTKRFWRQYWRPIIQHSAYTTGESGRGVERAED